MARFCHCQPHVCVNYRRKNEKTVMLLPPSNDTSIRLGLSVEFGLIFSVAMVVGSVVMASAIVPVPLQLSPSLKVMVRPSIVVTPPDMETGKPSPATCSIQLPFRDFFEHLASAALKLAATIAAARTIFFLSFSKKNWPGLARGSNSKTVGLGD